MIRITVSPAEAGSRLDKLVVQHGPGLGRAAVKKLFEANKVRITKEGNERSFRAGKGDVAGLGDVIEVDLDTDAPKGALPDANAAFVVLLERDDVVVLDKPAGQPSTPLAPGELGTAANALVFHYPEMASIGFSAREPGLCHRLDTDTSGILLAARTAVAFTTLTTALKEGRLDKRYWLLCRSEGLADTGSIDVPLAPHPKDKRRVLACIHPRDVARNAPRPATTSFEVLSRHGDVALVEARAPKALRHQIRAHFAAIEHPLLGDTLYGAEPIEGLPRHALHAQRLTWSGDAKVPAFAVVSELPEALKALLAG